MQWIDYIRGMKWMYKMDYKWIAYEVQRMHKRDVMDALDA
jgi:hypothetical protein